MLQHHEFQFQAVRTACALADQANYRAVGVWRAIEDD
jgi:hypothetical protein